MRPACRTLQSVIRKPVIFSGLDLSVSSVCSIRRTFLTGGIGENRHLWSLPVSYIAQAPAEQGLSFRTFRFGAHAETLRTLATSSVCPCSPERDPLWRADARSFSSSSTVHRQLRGCGWKATRGLSNKNLSPNVFTDAAAQKEPSQQAILEEERKSKVVLDPRNAEADRFYRRVEESLKKLGPAQPLAASMESDRSRDTSAVSSSPDCSEDKPSTLWARFKDMYKKYWYVLIPVHGALCVSWYGFFYYLALQGVDVMPWLERIGIPENILGYMRKSNAAHLAAAFAMYKLATPIRYAVTLGATTVTIDYLTRLGYIKPVPNAARLKQMIQDKGVGLRVLSKRGGRRLKRIRDKYKFNKKDR